MKLMIASDIHAPATICDGLWQNRFIAESCTDRLLVDANPGTTWFVVARKCL